MENSHQNIVIQNLFVLKKKFCFWFFSGIITTKQNDEILLTTETGPTWTKNFSVYW